jgi:hypothetical protein
MSLNNSTPISASPNKLTLSVAKSLNFLVLSTESVSRFFACFAISVRLAADASWLTIDHLPLFLLVFTQIRLPGPVRTPLRFSL